MGRREVAGGRAPRHRQPEGDGPGRRAADHGDRRVSRGDRGGLQPAARFPERSAVRYGRGLQVLARSRARRRPLCPARCRPRSRTSGWSRSSGSRRRSPGPGRATLGTDGRGPGGGGPGQGALRAGRPTIWPEWTGWSGYGCAAGGARGVREGAGRASTSGPMIRGMRCGGRSSRGQAQGRHCLRVRRSWL